MQELLPFVPPTNTETKAVLEEEKDLQVNYILRRRFGIHLIPAFSFKIYLDKAFQINVISN